MDVIFFTGFAEWEFYPWYSRPRICQFRFFLTLGNILTPLQASTLSGNTAHTKASTQAAAEHSSGLISAFMVTRHVMMRATRAPQNLHDRKTGICRGRIYST